MVQNISLLSNEELKKLFFSESQLFSDSMNNEVSFNDLKQIRLNLRDISVELKARKIPSQKGQGRHEGNDREAT